MSAPLLWTSTLPFAAKRSWLRWASATLDRFPRPCPSRSARDPRASNVGTGCASTTRTPRRPLCRLRATGGSTRAGCCWVVVRPIGPAQLDRVHVERIRQFVHGALDPVGTGVLARPAHPARRDGVDWTRLCLDDMFGVAYMSVVTELVGFDLHVVDRCLVPALVNDRDELAVLRRAQDRFCLVTGRPPYPVKVCGRVSESFTGRPSSRRRTSKRHMRMRRDLQPNPPPT